MSSDERDEWALFEREMRDVRPIKSEPKVPLNKSDAPADTLAQRREMAVREVVGAESNFLSGDYVPPVDPHDHLAFKRDGVQNGVYRNLRLGKYTVDARLDLHRMTVEESRRAVFQFVQDCMAQDIRCGLITHGKGVGRETPALLKSCVAHWLPQMHEVLAMHSAQPQHGGSGATYILLRKSERKRQENWERQHKRRG
ncbi:DNA endonuclease SmrA [Marinimicrobium sp. LS-A18]|uniref:DNA endonuclease SmrA n=1 Tax=Marinimicrobium sp. LS-A18 TaxID=1381596 RepID=UPI0004663920|nr:DNA endonuclease SmrA [Marinimicrobium sp. LS-A18]